MASEAEPDLSQLTPSQQETLQQYTDVTSQEIKDAIPLLQRSQWNLQVRPSVSRLHPANR
jgi:FAS-associated factor 2